MNSESLHFGLLIIHKGEHEVVVFCWVGTLKVRPIFAPVGRCFHKRGDRLDVRSQLGMALVFGEPLIMVVFAVSSGMVNRV